MYCVNSRAADAEARRLGELDEQEAAEEAAAKAVAGDIRDAFDALRDGKEGTCPAVIWTTRGGCMREEEHDEDTLDVLLNVLTEAMPGSDVHNLLIALLQLPGARTLVDACAEAHVKDVAERLAPSRLRQIAEAL